METKKRMRRTMLEIVQKIGEKEVIRNNSVWPPTCVGFAHQPKRPDKLRDKLDSVLE